MTIIWLFLAVATIFSQSRGQGLAKDCQLLWSKAEEDGWDVLLKKPAYMRAFEKCKRLEEDGQPMNVVAVDDDNVENDNGLLESLAIKPRSRTIDSVGCSISLFTGPNFQGEEVNFQDTTKGINVFEKSLRTFGSCCWFIWGKGNKRRLIQGNSNHKSFHEYNFLPGQIVRVVKLPHCLRKVWTP